MGGQYGGYVTKNCQKSCKKCGPGVTGPSCGKIFNLKSTDLVEMHNSWRSKVANNSLENKLGEQAKNMNMLTWDSTLAEQAQQWANQCKDGHSPKDQILVKTHMNILPLVMLAKLMLVNVHWTIGQKKDRILPFKILFHSLAAKKSEGDIGHWTA